MSLWKTLAAKWGSGAGEQADVRIDPSTSSLQTVDYAHHEVHAGSHFTFIATDGDLDAAAVLDFIITTPNTTKWAHMLLHAYGALHTKAYLYETTTHGTDAAQTAYNNNRNSATTPTVTIHTSDDAGADGTLIASTEFGIDTGNGSNRVFGGGESRGEGEWILKQNTKYLVRIESQTDNNVVALTIAWYEHTDHN